MRIEYKPNQSLDITGPLPEVEHMLRSCGYQFDAEVSELMFVLEDGVVQVKVPASTARGRSGFCALFSLARVAAERAAKLEKEAPDGEDTHK